MRIEEIDRNFRSAGIGDSSEYDFYDVRAEERFDFYGLHEARDASRAFHRIPKEVAEATSFGVAALNYHTAGGRIRFSTDSDELVLVCETKDPVTMMSHMPLTGSQGFDLYTVEPDGTSRFCRTFRPEPDLGVTSFSLKVDLPAGMHSYTLNFPLYGTVKNLLLGFTKGATLAHGARYFNDKPVVFYGSSITQGGCASRPGNSYQGFLSHKYNLDYINLGFSGSAKGEEAIARYLASLDTDLFICDYDHNSESPEHLAATLPALYRAVRAAHPNALFVFASSPGVSHGEERRAVVLKTYMDALEAGDANVRFVDGKDMFAGEAADCCTLEGCHPNDLGFYRMALAFEPYIVEYLSR